MTIGAKLRWLTMAIRDTEENEEEPTCETREKSLDELEEISRSHSLPGDMLLLREVDEGGGGELGVFSRLVLPRDSSFGPFKGAQIAETDREQHDCVIELTTKEDKVFLAVENKAGHWLKLVRSSAEEEKCNVSICLQGNGKDEGQTIWCEILRDIVEETELVATFGRTPDMREIPLPVKVEAPLPVVEERPLVVADMSDIKREACPTPDIRKPLSSPTSPVASPPRFPLIYGCVHCGIKFSNPSTLDAHISYYCTKKPHDTSVANGVEMPSLPQPVLPGPVLDPLRHTQPSPRTPAISISPKMKQEMASPGSKSSDDAHTRPSSSILKRPASTDPSDESNMSEDHPPKMARSDHLFQCPYCTYSSDRKVCLNRHLKLHSPGQERALASSPEEEGISLADMYCHECNIQFSSMKTFMGHKEFYCAMRQHRPSGSKSEESSPPSSHSPRRALEPSSPSPKTPLAMPSSGAFSMDSLLKSGATHMFGQNGLLPGQAAVVLAPLVGPNGMTSMFNLPTVIMQPVIAMQNTYKALHNQASSTTSTAPRSPSHTSTSPRKSSDELPLDLSVKKEEEEERKVENHKATDSPKAAASVSDQGDKPKEGSDLSPESQSHKSPVPSSRGSPCGASPSLEISRRSTPGSHHSDSLSSGPSQAIPTMTSPMALEHMLPVPPTISKCQDCNIVFYKYENYLIHKEHYCAGRQVKTVGHSPRPLTPGAHPFDIVNAGSSSEHSSPMQPTRSPSSHSPGASRMNGVPMETDMMTVDQGVVQYFCIPCKIRFSNIDTLRAHQKFYCPATHESKTESKQSPPSGSVEKHHQSVMESMEARLDEPALCTCQHCGNSYPSIRLLKLHFCKVVAAMQVPLLRCPYCDYITQTDQRLMEHIKAHAPTKAYKCTLCGYRGNTVRGMRMHGKTHMDAGENFTDEHMVEFEEPPLIPKRIKTVMPDNPLVDFEAELIRLKNEPYKRRRSRKSYEKVDVPIRHHTPNVCVLCNEVLPDGDHLHHHLRTQHADTIHTCKFCHFFTDDKPSLIAHIRMLHDPEHLHEVSSEVGEQYRHSRPAHYPEHHSPQPSIHTKEEMSSPKAIKKESNQSSSHNERSPAKIKTEEKENKYPSRAPSPYMENNQNSHSQYSDTREESEHDPRPSGSERTEVREILSDKHDPDVNDGVGALLGRESPSGVTEKLDSVSPGLSENEQNKMDSREESSSPSRSPTHNGVKVERPWPTEPRAQISEMSSDENCNGISKTTFAGLENDSQDLKTVLRKVGLSTALVPTFSQSTNGKNDNDITDSAAVTRNGSRPSSPPSGDDISNDDNAPSGVAPKNEKPSSRFCNQCQISFMYFSTYLAHKKHYCSVRTIENNEQVADVI